MDTTTNHTVGYVGRCKSCKAPIRYDLPEQRRKTYRYTREVRIYNTDGSGWYDHPASALTKPCLACGKPSSVKRLKASYAPEVKCGAKCRGATGPNCDCSCRGVNHGRG